MSKVFATPTSERGVGARGGPCTAHAALNVGGAAAQAQTCRCGAADLLPPVSSQHRRPSAICNVRVMATLHTAIVSLSHRNRENHRFWEVAP